MHRGIFILIAAAALCGFFAFGTMATSFAREALALFFVFAAVSAVWLAAHAFWSAGHGPRHGERALLLSGRFAGTIAMAAFALALVTLWSDLASDAGIAQMGQAMAAVLN